MKTIFDKVDPKYDDINRSVYIQVENNESIAYIN